MKTALISMVRNEIDIIDVWIQHQLAFHDFIFCVDHRSDDGTGNYLIEVSKKFPSLRYFTIRNARTIRITSSNI